MHQRLPAAVDDLDNSRVAWFSFAALSDAIDTALADSTATVSEQARFLLREFQALLVEDGLLDTDDVVVVAAREAYPEYLRHSAYVCQPGRSFREGLTHMGFYTHGAIQPEVPRIRFREDDVLFTPAKVERRREGEEHDRRVAELIEVLLREGPRQQGEASQVFLLTPPDDPDTIPLEHKIVNDTVAASGRTWAWTMDQCYVSMTRLTAPDVSRTSDLE